MMFETKPRFFKPIQIPVPREAVFRRLGYRKNKTRLDADQSLFLDDTIEDARALVRLAGCSLMLPVEYHEESAVGLEGGVVFKSRSLARLLSDSSMVMLLGATAGRDVMSAIERATSQNDMTRAVIIDAVASEMTDAALDWIMSLTDQELKRKRRHLTRMRYSAGYGDFPLENQRTVFNLLHLEDLGVELTPGNILMPEKSVTAICGVEFSLKQKD